MTDTPCMGASTRAARATAARPTSVSGAADPHAEGGHAPRQINKLLGHFQQNTGSSFSGQGDQFDQLAAMAARFTGYPIPASILRKL